jgi:hypothetical protein
MTEERSPIDLATDLFVYAPIGLAIRLSSVLPDLVETGRTHAELPVNMARTMSKAVWAQQKHTPAGARLHDALRTAEECFAPLAAKGSLFVETMGQRASRAAPDAEPTAAPRSGSTEAPKRPTSQKRTDKSDKKYTASRASTGGARPTPDASSLPIANYTSLSATQVVANLRGLQDADLRAIRDYEVATRARRTILDRIDALLT